MLKYSTKTVKSSKAAGISIASEKEIAASIFLKTETSTKVNIIEIKEMERVYFFIKREDNSMAILKMMKSTPAVLKILRKIFMKTKKMVFS